MSENLKVIHYNNGDEISYPSNGNGYWGDPPVGQYSVYDNNPINADLYGNLYNWYAATDERGVCPEGFHVPSDDEIMELEMELGMSEEEANSPEWRGTDEGSKLAGNSALWDDGDLENNSEFGTSGFNGLPGGYYMGNSGSMGLGGYFWSSSDSNSSDAWSRRLNWSMSDVLRESISKMYGFSVRCLQDDIDGCTDPYADNYDDTANWDDGSCAGYPDNGDYSLQFDGVDDYVGLPEISNSIGAPNSSFSISAWFKKSISDMGVLIHASSQFQYICPRIETAPENKIGYYHRNPNTNNEGRGDLIFNLGEWNNLTYVVDGNNGSIEVYINGINDPGISQSFDPSETYYHEDRIWQMGAITWDAPHWMEGQLDNVSIWSTAFTQEEIQFIMTNPPAGDEDNLVGYWNFNAGSGTTLYDHSGNQNHGTINGGATWAACTDDSACNYVDSEVEDDGSCWYAEENYDCDGNCLAEFDCNGICGGGAVMDECENCGGDGYIANCLDNDNCDDMDCNGNCGGEAYLDNCGVCSAGMSEHSPNSDIDCNGDCAADTPISCEDTTGNSQCGNATEDDCEICSGGNSGHIANSDMDECSVCFSDNFAGICIDSDDCSLMDCNGDCGGIDGIPNNGDEAIMDACNVCSEGNTGHPYNDDMDCLDVCNGDAIEDDFGWCCANITEIDICGECTETGGNNYDMCDGDGDSDYNIDDWGYGAHGFGDSIGILVEDIPEDQGGRVYITFYKSFYDTDTLRNNESYTIERLDSETWTSLHSIAAYGSETYQTVAETLNDATDADTAYTEFRIIASMNEGNFVSQDDENGFGFSVDNIHPTTPELTFAEHEGDDITINWQYALEEDFDYHEITGLWNTTYSTENTLGYELSATNDEHRIQSVDINDNHSESSESLLSRQLNAGANLISFNVLPEDVTVSNVLSSLGCNVTGVITEGGACSQIACGTWVGSQCSISAYRGYWVIMTQDDILLIVGYPTDRNIIYELHSGANLIGYPYRYATSTSNALPEEAEYVVGGVITEGGACSQINPGQWVGSQCSFIGGKGYWIILDEAVSLSFINGCDEIECASLSRKSQNLSTIPDGYEYTQSSKQAFYFIESIENIKAGDWILSYNGDEVIGARQWQGSIIDVPAMGSDGNEYSDGYMQSGGTPEFKLLSGGKLINLEGEVPAWSDNGLFMVSSLTQAVIPVVYSLSQAYPNPFNPVTTLSFAIPVDSEVSLSIYNLQGRVVSTLISGNMDAGYHSVVWDANQYSSGVYFVKMVAGEFVNTQKLMLIK